MIHHAITIQLKNDTYPVYIGQNLLSDSALLCRHISSKHILIVTNDTVAPLYLNRVLQAYASVQCEVVILPDGEAHKDQKSLFTIYDALIQAKYHRDTTLISLGGGVVGDITGFAAATFQRGVRLVHMPTTLLAQVDASIGGKTAINHLRAKNILGSFYQPHAVIMDVNTLSTLPAREFKAGLGEVIKYGLLIGGDFLNEIDQILTAELSPSSTHVLSELIARCVQIKAEFVEEDEREAGRRALLNLGHTFAHALESYTHYQRWLHGEAVAIGLFCAALLSFQLKLISRADVDKIDSLLARAQLPRRIPKDIDLITLLSLMSNDKKIKNKTLRFVLMRALGDCYLEDKVTEYDLRHVLDLAVEE